MATNPLTEELYEPERDEAVQRSEAPSTVSRRDFVQLLGAGLLISATAGPAPAQRRRSRRGARNIAARLHIAPDGAITVMTGKVEIGQGARAEISQAAAEELRVSVDRVRLIMGDTRLCPDDGVTAGSRTTPSTIPAVRRATAAARDLLVELASKQWQGGRDAIEVSDGAIVHSQTNRRITYGDLAAEGVVDEAFAQDVPRDVAVTPVKEWEVMGTSVPRPNARDLVVGSHLYPSDFTRPNMLHGKVLRPPSYGATLESIDLGPAEAMEGVVVVREGEFVGCAAPTTFRASQAVEAIAQTARWKPAPHPSSKKLFAYLKEHAQRRGGDREVERALKGADKALRETYEIAYVQHTPMETRAALAEWENGALTVRVGTQAPFRVHSQLARELGVDSNRVRVIMPDMGSGFGGKHSGEVAVEAARLARAADCPVALKWTREEEFTWAYFRPAGVIEVAAGLDGDGRIVAWDFTNINSGGAAIRTPYEIAEADTRYVRSDPPLRQGSYRCLAATANNFARECMMDELAVAAGADPLAFRRAHLTNDRLRAVLEEAAKRFGWDGRKRAANVGCGLACGTEKGSYVAGCAEVAVDRETGRIDLRRFCEVFECGAIINPDNLRAQVQGCILMGLGAALREEMRFENGKILNASFARYLVPRFKDVPPLDIHLLDRPDLESVGGGETPIIAIAPAIANAVFDATGLRVRAMPIRIPATRNA